MTFRQLLQEIDVVIVEKSFFELITGLALKFAHLIAVVAVYSFLVRTWKQF